MIVSVGFPAIYKIGRSLRHSIHRPWSDLVLPCHLVNAKSKSSSLVPLTVHRASSAVFFAGEQHKIMRVKKGGKGKAVAKGDLPTKTCVVCNRPFTWWAGLWAAKQYSPVEDLKGFLIAGCHQNVVIKALGHCHAGGRSGRSAGTMWSALLTALYLQSIVTTSRLQRCERLLM